MKSVWLKWTIEHKYKFPPVKLTEAEVNEFSAAAREFLNEELDPTTDKIVRSIASLQYDVPGKEAKAKPQSNDQVMKCKLYVREATKLWRRSQIELGKRLTEYIARSSARIATKEDESEVDSGSRQLRSESSYLQRIGVGTLKQWVEDDQDEMAEKERNDKKESAAEAAKEHEQWVKKKDSLRIRLPTPEQLSLVVPKPPSRMGYGKELSAVRPQRSSAAKNTLEIMARSGLKYVHATSKGHQGGEGDYEAGQKLLKQIQKEESAKHESDRVAKEESEKAYEKWTMQKVLNFIILFVNNIHCYKLLLLRLLN